MKKRFITIIIISILTTLSLAMTAQEVLDEMEASNQEFDTSRQQYELTGVDADGNEESTKLMDSYILVTEGNGDEKENYTMMRVVEPRNLSGTTVMTLSEDEQYVYMPDYRKVKRITGNSKNDNFLDTDLKYSDISLLSGEVKEDNEPSMLDETDTHYTIKVDILDSETDYDYMVMVITKNELLLEKTEFYNASGEKVKEMLISDYTTIDGYRIFKKLEITDLEKDHKTLMELLEAEFDIPITERFFSTLNMSSRVLRYR